MSSFSSENLENVFDFINVALHTGKRQTIKYLFSNQFPKKILRGFLVKQLEEEISESSFRSRQVPASKHTSTKMRNVKYEHRKGVSIQLKTRQRYH